ncbi:MAG: hypothetical protein PHX10_03650 [Gallionellaceae bacterium]|nr:hypothetical protein [Gallionellaceae bacterium]
MLNIGQKQHDALMEAMRSTFKQRLVVRVQKQFPAYAAAVGERGVAGLVDLALQRSQRRGYRAERESVLWLDLMVRLGAAFDDDPLLPWGGKLADAAPGGDSLAQLNEINDTAAGYLDKVAGAAGERWAAAIGRFIQGSPQELVVQPAQSSELLVNTLASLYPEKHQAAGYPALQAFMQGTIARSLKAGVNAKDKIVLLILCDFLLGWEASASPVFLPVLTNAGATTLADTALPELLQRMKALMQGLLATPQKGR